MENFGATTRRAVKAYLGQSWVTGLYRVRLVDETNLPNAGYCRKPSGGPKTAHSTGARPVRGHGGEAEDTKRRLEDQAIRSQFTTASLFAHCGRKSLFPNGSPYGKNCGIRALPGQKGCTVCSLLTTVA